MLFSELRYMMSCKSGNFSSDVTISVINSHKTSSSKSTRLDNEKKRRPSVFSLELKQKGENRLSTITLLICFKINFERITKQSAFYIKNSRQFDNSLPLVVLLYSVISHFGFNSINQLKWFPHERRSTNTKDNLIS